jgi:hypothetical protein
MRAVCLALALVACGNTDQSFTNADKEGEGATGVGVFSVTPSEILFEDLIYEGESGPISQSQVFAITNTGDGNLQIYATSLADSADGVFHLDENDTGELFIAPGSTREMDIVATLDTYAEAVGQIRIQTSDGDALDHRMTVTARPVGWVAGGDDTGAP